MSATTSTIPTSVQVPAAQNTAELNTPLAPNCSLYVGDLHPDVTETNLFDIFSAVGQVGSIRICRDSITRRSLGYGYVNFHQHEDAVRALDILNFERVKGRPCRIMWSQRDPSLRKSGVGNIFVKNLDESIDNQQLYDTFSQFGNILSCKVSVDKEGLSRGYGFVHYDSDEAADRAIDEANGMLLPEKPVHVAKFLRRAERRGAANWTNCFVKNVPVEWDEAKITEMFEPHGKITSCFIKMDANGKSLGFGFINFEEHEAAKAACDALNEFKVGEETVPVKSEGDDELAEGATEVRDKLMYVGRHQKKSERERELSVHFKAEETKRMERFAGRNLYVRNLDESVDDKKLLEIFTELGSISSAVVMRNANNTSRGFGFVCFSTAEEATTAVTSMNNKMVEGKPIYVALAQRKEARKAQLENQRRNMAMTRGGMNMGAPMRGYPAAPMPYGMMNPAAPMPYGMMPRGGMPMGYGPRPGVPSGMMAHGAANVRGPAPAPVVQQAPAVQAASSSGLTAAALAAASPEERINMIGERLYPQIAEVYPAEAAKITGMLLEMETGDLLHLLESPAALHEKMSEAMNVLRTHSESS